jgi:hypothetical protein
MAARRSVPMPYYRGKGYGLEAWVFLVAALLFAEFVRRVFS